MVFALPVAAQTTGSSEAMETVTVTGYRASLDKALEMKRDSVGARDSIVAEDIGKYPATNIAESLLRVPGVVLSRDTRTDEGRQLTVRGLPAAYTIVTINGNPVHMETNGDVGSNARSVDLDAFGADLFSRVDFYKSPSARLDEGGIGGVIDLRTPHPFDYEGRQISYSLGYGMNSQREKAVPTATFQASNTWGPFGALIAVTAKRSSYAFWGNETAGISQACNENGYMGNGEKYDFGLGKTGVCGTSSWAGVDSRANIGSYTIAQVEQAFVPRWGRDHLTMDDRTRYSGLLSFQFKPNEKLDMSFDLMGAELIDATDEYTIGTYFRSTGNTTAAAIAAAAGDPTKLGKTSDTNGLVPLSIGIDSNDILYGTFGNVQMQSGNVWYRGKDKFLSGTFNAKYQVLDNLKLVAEAGVADYHGFIAQDTLSAYIYNTTLTYDPRDNYKFPSMVSSVDLTNPALYQGNTAGTRAGFDTAGQYLKEGDRILTGKLAAQYGFESGLSALGHVDLEYGLSWVGNTKSNDQRNNANLVKNTTLSNGSTLAAMLPSAYMVNHIKVRNYLDDANYTHRITNWATVPDSVYYMVPFNSILAADTSGNWYPSVFKLTEGVTSFYLNASSAGEVLGRTLKVDVGIRYAITRQWGYNFASQKDSSGNLTYPKVKLHSSYDSILPTVSVSYDLMDNLVARAAFGKTITRADLGSIAKGASVPNIYNPNVTVGNPKLKPFMATNFDAGLEWYFDQGSVLSFGVFYKGIKNLISTQTTTGVAWGTLNLPDSLLASNQHINNDAAQPVDPNYLMNVTHPVNLNPMVVKGFEVFYQEPFSFLPAPFDGLGAMASFTYTAGTQNGPGTGFTANDGTIYRMQLRGLSTYSYSATGYYEKDGISLRLSYNWRSKAPADDSLDNLNYYKTNSRIWTQARGTLDATLGYAFNDWAEVRFDVSNLLNAQEIAMLVDGTGKNSQIGARASGFGDPRAHNFYDYVHGRNYMISLRGHL
jgi:TonB-dependent receptor